MNGVGPGSIRTEARHLLRHLAGCASAFLVAACSDVASPSARVARVEIVPSSVQLLPDSSLQLVATPFDSAGNALTGRVVTWTSLNGVARVSPGGLVHAQVVGSARVVAVIEERSDTAVVSVLVPVDSVRMFPARDSVLTGDSVWFDVGLFDSVGHPVTPRPITWSVDDTTRAVVPSTFARGVVRGVRPGVTRVRAAIEGRTDSAVVIVLAPVAQFRIAPDTLDLQVGSSAPLALTMLDSAGNAVIGRLAIWSVTGLGATVSPSGMVGSVAAGDARLIAAVGGRADTSLVRSRTDGSARMIAAGDIHSCAASTAGTLYCWGLDTYGQLGSGLGSSSTASRTGSLPVPAALFAGVRNTCVLTTIGEAWCWGLNNWGQAGNAIGTSCSPGWCQLTPTRVADTLTFTRLALGASHVCGIRADGTAWCWGQNSYGQLGSGAPDFQRHSQPMPVSGGLSFIEIASGAEHSCAIDTGGAAYCWGFNYSGQLGTGTPGGIGDYFPTPLAVSGSHTFVTIAAFGYRTCALDTGGAPWCWGDGYAAAPTAVPGGRTFATVHVGRTHVCALASNSTVWCWGNNQFGQLGNGTNTSSTAPVEVAGGFTLLALATGSYHNCGVAPDGRVYCWGEGSQYELGIGASGAGFIGVPTPAIGWP